MEKGQEDSWHHSCPIKADLSSIFLLVAALLLIVNAAVQSLLGCWERLRESKREGERNREKLGLERRNLCKNWECWRLAGLCWQEIPALEQEGKRMARKIKCVGSPGSRIVGLCPCGMPAGKESVNPWECEFAKPRLGTALCFPYK